MKKSNLCIIVLVCFGVSGCYSYGGYTPTVDAYGDKNAYRINQDMAECRQLAEQSSGGGTGKETLIGAGVGGLIGAAALLGLLRVIPGWVRLSARAQVDSVVQRSKDSLRKTVLEMPITSA